MTEFRVLAEDDQTHRVVLNLDDTVVTVDEMAAQLEKQPIFGLEEVIAIKGGRIVRALPSPPFPAWRSS